MTLLSFVVLVLLYVCKFIESQIPCMCSHAWPTKLILKAVAMTGDNASNIDAAAKKRQILGCFTHIFNTAAQKSYTITTYPMRHLCEILS